MPTLTELNLYPVKSCAGISLREAVLTPAGLMVEQIYDREWMVVDAKGEFMTQRDFPKMALITPRIKADTLELRAPGMLRLEVPLGLPDPEDAKVVQVRVWEDTVQAYDCDEVTATWFTKFLGTPCRLVRFHAEAKRVASSNWTGDVEALALFADAFPMLVISEGSLADLNGKLKAQGREVLPMNRFRPNIVIGGVEAFEEDIAKSFRIGAAKLKPVKPCSRCNVPSVDQSTGIPGPDPLDIMQSYRANPKLDGALTFGMNTILLEGEGQVLRIGQDVDIDLAF
ncbi:MOSC domain-containing protein [Noviherbaspirillum denitrificans]|uniref:Fe-S protein n=1 Tax=Noviherbaspirillum denitrificans TaxID=1968433 RepID=A0A254TAW5_9BURK|nr:MOSC N-terminal beta barrel domain-containing protein [Noviherbaspirillum denitrificans]OWW19789.1 Fe-S protein [Noviherbaspirillum denitrificans]